MPFAGYQDFESCVADNSDKNDPEAYCSVIKRQVEGKSEAFDVLSDDRVKAVLDDHGQDLLADLINTSTDAGQKTAVAAGQHAPVNPVEVQSAKVDLPSLDPDNPPEEFSDALEAEDFIIYGRASIEKFDEGGQNSDVPEVIDLSPEVVEKALDRFFESEKAPGIISIAHDDIPVGRPLREYTLDEETAIEVDGEVYEFEAGDTITTHVEDGDQDGRPELWMVADLANETPIHRKVRLAALMGELDGFSVTFGRNDYSLEGPGRRVTAWDLYSVTIAPDDLIANKGSEFDLAAFKALFDTATQKGEFMGYNLSTDGDPGDQEAFHAFLDALVEAGGDVWQVRNGQLYRWPDDEDFPMHDPRIKVVGVPEEEFQEILESHDVEFMQVGEGLGQKAAEQRSPTTRADDVAVDVPAAVEELVSDIQQFLNQT